MKLKISALCWECVKEAGNTRADYQQLMKERPEMAGEHLVELNQENLYRIECHKGHVSYTILQHQKFELLFDFAAMALLDGYTREAVADMAAALERFYEFYISTICLEKGIAVGKFGELWKLLDKQSERQLGAFLLLSLMEGNDNLPNLTKRIEFRNRVIHQGYIPSTAEAIDYGEYVLALITKTMCQLRTIWESQWHLGTHRHLLKNRDRMTDAVRIATLSTPTIINVDGLFADDFTEITFEEALARMSENSYSRAAFVRSI